MLINSDLRSHAAIVAPDTRLGMLGDADDVYDRGHHISALRLYKRVARASACWAKGENVGDDELAAYAMARLAGLSVEFPDDDALNKHACRLNLFRTRPYDRALLALQARQLPQAFTLLRAAFATDSNQPPTLTLSQNPGTFESSRISIAMFQASLGHFDVARHLVVEAATQEFYPGDSLFFLAQIYIGEGRYREAKRTLADSIPPRQAPTTFPSLSSQTWAAAYELQTFLRSK